MTPGRPSPSPAPSLLLACALAFAAVTWTHAQGGTPASPPRKPALGEPGGPVLASEDTIPVPAALLPTMYVTAPRVTLDEILRRVAEGEARRDSQMVDQTYTMYARITYLDADNKVPTGAKTKLDYVSRVYKKRPDMVREIPLRQTTEIKRKGDKGDGSDDDVQVDSGPNMREEIVSFAFEPRMRARYRFRIDDRKLVGGHVVYLISFTPRSAVDGLPEGRVWVDTNDFVIVREEFWYHDRSPAPLFFKRLDSCVVERTRVDNRWWVVSRILARVQLTSMVRMFARMGKEPLTPTVDFAATQTDWRINQGIPDSVFTGGKR